MHGGDMVMGMTCSRVIVVRLVRDSQRELWPHQIYSASKFPILLHMFSYCARKKKFKIYLSRDLI